MNRYRTTTLLVLAMWLSLGMSSAARDPLVSAGSPLLGGGSGGGVNPTPPIGNAPVDPSLSTLPGGGPILLQVLGSGRRVVVLRSRDGRLLRVALLEPGQGASLWVPRDGALLDVLGTDVVGLPVVPGVQLTVAPGS